MKSHIRTVVFTVCILHFLCSLTVSTFATTVRFYLAKDSFDVLLYDYTPRHKAVFLSAIKNGEYSSQQFNRIIENFVVQGGMHDVEIAAEELKSGKSNGRLLPEFDQRAYHKLGAIGAGRDDNAAKASFLSQIYFVVGKKWTIQQLDSLTNRTGKKITTKQKQDYLNVGGQPRLDNDYTVFGEIVSGLDVLLKLSTVSVDEENYPNERIYFSVKVVEE